MKASSITDTNKRDQNEDNRLIVPKSFGREKCLLAAVFDGMGGTDAGEVASKMAKELIEKWFENYKITSFPGSIKDELIDLIASINEKIFKAGDDMGKTLGTTSAILIIYKNEYIAVNIGDSRIYKFSAKNLQVTKDQTVAQLEVDRGNLTPEEALTDKRSHVLTQSLGQRIEPIPDFFRGKCKKGDTFLLCSDGMYNRVEIDELAEVVKEKSLSLQEKLLEMAILSKSKEEKDNITGILVEI